MTNKVKVEGKHWVLKNCSRKTIVKRILERIQNEDFPTLNSISGWLSKDHFAKEPKRRPKDPTNLEQLRQIIQKIKSTCGQDAYLPLRLLSVLFEGWNAKTCITAAQRHLNIQVPNGKIKPEDKYANILQVLKDIFQEYLNNMQNNNGCKTEVPSVPLSKVSGIKKQTKTRRKKPIVIATGKNSIEFYFKRISPAVSANNSNEAVFTRTSDTREAEQMPASNVDTRQNTSQAQTIAPPEGTRNIEIQWHDRSSEVVNVGKWEANSLKQFPYMDVSGQELTFSEEENVVDYLKRFSGHVSYVPVTFSRSKSKKLRKVREKLVESDSFLKCDQFPNRLIIIPVTEAICRIIQGLNINKKQKPGLIAMYFKPRQPLRLAATNNSI